MTWDTIKTAMLRGADFAGEARKKATAVVTEFASKHPNEVGYTAGGAATGVLAGAAIGGGIGIAAFGGAVGVPVVLVAAIAGSLAGNGIGVRKDASSGSGNPE